MGASSQARQNYGITRPRHSTRNRGVLLAVLVWRLGSRIGRFQQGKLTNDSPNDTAFGPNRLSPNTKWSRPTSTTLLLRVP